MDEIVVVFGIGLVIVSSIAAVTIICCARIWRKHKEGS